MTGRHEVLVSDLMDPERLAVIRTYCEPPGMQGHIELVTVATRSGHRRARSRRARGRARRAHRRRLLRDAGRARRDRARTARRIAALAHAHGAETIVGVDPISLGVLAPPGQFGADIAVGPTQPLGVHMNCGGGVGGFIASRDEERYAREYPTLQVSLCPTSERASAASR